MALNKNIRAVFCSAISALLGLVIVFNLSFNAFHIKTEEHHHASEQTCSPNEEIDACHRFLIHNEKSAGCNGGHEHLGTKADDCFSCKYYKQRNDFSHFENHSSIQLAEFKVSYTTICFLNKIQNYPSYYLRGPPITA
jgi:hypothetical protein